MTLRRRVVASVAGSLAAGLLLLLGVYASLPDPGILKVENPGTTAFVQRLCSGDCPLEWTPLPEISVFLRRAVVLAEDASFFEHGPVHVASLRQALLRNLREGRIVWGGSTLTMQLARNLYLYPEQTLKRKALEILLAVKLERALAKERILELYLNVAEWAPDVFGAAAASRHYFGKPPGDLGPLEAAFLASILPSPRRAAEPAMREFFSAKGAIIFDRLTWSFLPRGQNTVEDPDSCPERLPEEEARMADTVLGTLFARFGGEVASGDGALITSEELQSTLGEEQREFVRDIVARLAGDRPPLPCRRGRDGRDGELTAWNPDAGDATVRSWFPGPVLAGVRSLTDAAAGDGVPLTVHSAYRSPSYQTYLILAELRKQDYCMTAVKRVIEGPDQTEHACLDTTAVDFGAPDGSGPDFARTPTFRWLERNAPDFGFTLSYPREDPDGVGREPWHWRFTGTAAPGLGPDAAP